MDSRGRYSTGYFAKIACAVSVSAMARIDRSCSKFWPAKAAAMRWARSPDDQCVEVWLLVVHLSSIYVCSDPPLVVGLLLTFQARVLTAIDNAISPRQVRYMTNMQKNGTRIGFERRRIHAWQEKSHLRLTRYPEQRRHHDGPRSIPSEQIDLKSGRCRRGEPPWARRPQSSSMRQPVFFEISSIRAISVLLQS
jgi:hypothetical protein